MKTIKRLIVRLVAWAVAEDFKANGSTRQLVLNEQDRNQRY
jgi:hypothetical protein